MAVESRILDLSWGGVGWCGLCRYSSLGSGGGLGADGLTLAVIGWF